MPDPTSTSPMPTSQAPQQPDPVQALLQQMNDVKTPDPVGWWPLAPGWWIVLLLAAIIIGAATTTLIRRWLGNRYRRVALRTLADLQTQRPSPRAFIEQGLVLSKRTFFTAYPGSQGIAGNLYGKAWIDALYRTNPSHSKNHLHSKMAELVERLYHKDPHYTDQDAKAFAAFLDHWIRHHKALDTATLQMRLKPSSAAHDTKQTVPTSGEARYA